MIELMSLVPNGLEAEMVDRFRGSAKAMRRKRVYQLEVHGQRPFRPGAVRIPWPGPADKASARHGFLMDAAPSSRLARQPAGQISSGWSPSVPGCNARRA